MPHPLAKTEAVDSLRREMQQVIGGMQRKVDGLTNTVSALEKRVDKDHAENADMFAKVATQLTSLQTQADSLQTRADSMFNNVAAQFAGLQTRADKADERRRTHDLELTAAIAELKQNSLADTRDKNRMERRELRHKLTRYVQRTRKARLLELVKKFNPQARAYMSKTRLESLLRPHIFKIRAHLQEEDEENSDTEAEIEELD